MTLRLNSTAENFKAFVLSGASKEEIIEFCDELAEDLIPGRESSELYSEIGSITGTFYCPDQELCERYGFSSGSDLEADIKEVSEATGADVNKVADALHKDIGEAYHLGGFYADTIVFVDLEKLRRMFDGNGPFYIVVTKYTGPNQDQGEYVDADTIEITRSPAITNNSCEERTEGWCGTTNDWAVYAHGEYATIEEARNAIAEMFGEVRESDESEDVEFNADNADVIAIYKPGKYKPLSSQETADWAYESMQSDIKADTTDEEIEEKIKEYESEANGYSWTLDSDLEDFMKEVRQQKQDELFTINHEEEFCGVYGPVLSPLGGSEGSDEDLGLNDWCYQFEITAYNDGAEMDFTIAFQPEERSNGMKAYSGYDIAPASMYGYDADQSEELLEFFEHDSKVLDILSDKAKEKAKEAFHRERDVGMKTTCGLRWPPKTRHP